MVGSGSFPPAEGTEYGATRPDSVGEPELVFKLDTESKSIAVRAEEDNNAKVYLGWDTDLDTDNGFPVYPTESFEVDMDVSNQELFMVVESVGDAVRVIAVD